MRLRAAGWGHRPLCQRTFAMLVLEAMLVVEGGGGSYHRASIRASALARTFSPSPASIVVDHAKLCGGRNFMAHIFVPDTRGTNNLYYNIIEIGVRARFRELFAITWTWIRQFFQVNNIWKDIGADNSHPSTICNSSIYIRATGGFKKKLSHRETTTHILKMVWNFQQQLFLTMKERHIFCKIFSPRRKKWTVQIFFTNLG